MRGRAAVTMVTCGVLFAAPAFADEPTLRANDFSAYEQSAIDAALADLHEEREPAPDGKIVEGVDIVTLDVIDPRDPAPSIINVFHATTRRYVIDREVLLRPGDRWTHAAVDQTIRNLRAKIQLSLVLAIPVRGSAPDRVRLLVITKDVWSLRLNWNLQASSGGLEDFVIQPSEINFLGTHNAASLLFELDPATATFGVGYRAPRLGGTWVTLTGSANAIVNRASGRPEGSTGTLVAFQPLYSPKTAWSWDSSVQWDDEIARRFVNAREVYFAAGPIRQDYVPWAWDQRTYLAQESVTRSLGVDVKNDFTLGGQVDLRGYRVTDASSYSPYAVSRFTALEVPRSDDRVAPFVQWHSYRTRFVRMLDNQTLSLQEDYRLGHELYVRVYPVTKALGSSRDFLGVYAAAQYTIPIGDGIARANVESTTEGDASSISDGYLDGEVQVVTPRLGRIGRFVYDAFALSRYRNYLNAKSFLGGNSTLRGYPTNYFVGKDELTSNLEFRTTPIEILHTLELGAAVFYDVGNAFDGWKNVSVRQSVGFGVRTLFPQLDRNVFRFDLGFPIGSGAHIPGVSPVAFFISFSQAFDMPSLTTAALPSGPN